MVKTSPSNAGGAVLIPVQGAKIPHASWPENQNIKQKQHCNKFNKDFKNGPHQKNLKKKVLEGPTLTPPQFQILCLYSSTMYHWPPCTGKDLFAQVCKSSFPN